MKKYTWIHESGIVVRKTVKDFVRDYGFRESHTKSMACGYIQTLNGWCSGHKSAKKRRMRFTTELVNTKSGERKILGRSVTKFAREHGLSAGRLSRLVNRSRIVYKGWMLGSAFNQAHGAVPGQII